MKKLKPAAGPLIGGTRRDAKIKLPEPGGIARRIRGRLGWRSLVIGLAAWALCLPGGLRAEAVLSLVLDDPSGLIKSRPEGIAKVTAEFSPSKATIASGTGGRALPQIAPGPASEQAGNGDEAKLQVLAEPAMGTPAFFRATLKPDSVTRSVGLGILPAAVGNSLSGLVSEQDGRTVIDGGFDLFFRVTVDGNSAPRLGIRTKAGPMGLNISTDPQGHALSYKVFTSGKEIDTDGDKTGDKAVLSGRTAGEVIIDSGTIYHLAVTFRTNPEGAVTIDICLAPGTGPLKVADSTVGTLAGFWLAGSGAKAEAEKVAITLGQSQYAQSLDLAAFRIFKPAPTAFPGLDGK